MMHDIRLATTHHIRYWLNSLDLNFFCFDIMLFHYAGNQLWL